MKCLVTIEESLYKISKSKNKYNTSHRSKPDTPLYPGKINKIVKLKHNDSIKQTKDRFFQNFISYQVTVTCFVRIVDRIIAI